MGLTGLVRAQARFSELAVVGQTYNPSPQQAEVGGNYFKFQDSVSLEAGRIRERKEKGRRKVWSENRKKNLKTGQALTFPVAVTGMTMRHVGFGVLSAPLLSLVNPLHPSEPVCVCGRGVFIFK